MCSIDFDRLKSNWKSVEDIEKWLHKPEYQDAVARHLQTTWINKRPDIIECFIGAIEFLLDDAKKKENK